LRKAKITSEAALRKVEKQRKEMEAATKREHGDDCEIEKAASELEVAKREAEQSTRRVAEAVKNTEEKMQEAENFLEEVKRKGGVAHGAIWWIERELKEAKKYLPRNKQ